jgi:hypothetical protein
MVAKMGLQYAECFIAFFRGETAMILFLGHERYCGIEVVLARAEASGRHMYYLKCFQMKI